MKILYHANCNDGFAAAWVARLKYGEENNAYIPVNYGQPPPEGLQNEDVLILDFSYKRSIMEELIAKCRSVVVLDHHKTAEAELSGLPNCHFDMNRSGCMMTWNYLFPDATAPMIVEYCQDRDLWRHQLPNTKEIHAWISSHMRNFEVWDKLSNTDLEIATQQGAAILRFIKQQVAAALEHVRQVEFGGYVVPCVHTTVHQSEIAGALAELAAFGVAWYVDGDKIKVSLRSRGDFDVSQVAAIYGGGGHKNAAGFTVSLGETYLFVSPREKFDLNFLAGYAEGCKCEHTTEAHSVMAAGIKVLSKLGFLVTK